MSLEETLLEEIRSRRCLYDSKHLFYKNVKIKDRAWSEIASKLGIKPEVARKKWKLLRDRYLQRRKVANDFTTEPNLNASENIWSSHMPIDFLEDVTDISDKDEGEATDVDDPMELCPSVYPESRIQSSCKSENNSSPSSCKEVSDLVEEFKFTLSENTAIQSFYHSIALQIEEANMKPKDVHNLQKKLFNAVQKILAQDK